MTKEIVKGYTRRVGDTETLWLVREDGTVIKSVPHEFSHSFDGVWWIDAEQDDAVPQDADYCGTYFVPKHLNFYLTRC